ncbi:MAG: hypothetical protein ACI9BW_000017 [Gammaproteobacteria bacterium]|jgi:hypothetical protein
MIDGFLSRWDSQSDIRYPTARFLMRRMSDLCAIEIVLTRRSLEHHKSET